MIAQLGTLLRGRVGVLARWSSMVFKGSLQRAREVGEALRADYLLEGSVRREDNRVRITARLIETREETQLWSDTYERPVTDYLSVQTEVATRIARSLAMELAPAPLSGPAASRCGRLSGVLERALLLEQAGRFRSRSGARVLWRGPEDRADVRSGTCGCGARNGRTRRVLPRRPASGARTSPPERAARAGARSESGRRASRTGRRAADARSRLERRGVEPHKGHRAQSELRRRLAIAGA